MDFRTYREADYLAVCDFLVELNRKDRDHIHWNWARFEWMIEHPEFDRSAAGSIGLWSCGERIVGAAIYDMYFGDAFCAALPEQEELYPEILDYAWRELRDDKGLGIAICDRNLREIEAAKKAGFVLAEQTETVMKRELDGVLPAVLPEGLALAELDPEKDGDMLQWLVWQGFDHGEDRAEFEKTKQSQVRNRRHFNKQLSLGAVCENGEGAACCCLWYREDTDYAYVEPVCTIPAWRGRGAARAILQEAMNRARSLGAKRAYVISDQAFYRKLGFETDRRFSFYWKRESLPAAERKESRFTVRLLAEGETEAALRLAWKVFVEFESPDYAPEGTEEFRKTLRDDAYLAGIRYYGAFDGQSLAGMLGFREEKAHLCFFFVDGAYHRQGIGTSLFKRLREDCPGRITVNSSPYGLPFYRRLGFTATDTEQTFRGIRFTPMEYKGEKDDAAD